MISVWSITNSLHMDPLVTVASAPSSTLKMVSVLVHTLLIRSES